MSNPLLHRPSPAVGAPHWLSDRLLARVITGLLAFLLAESTCQVGVSTVGLAAALRMLQVFPFDYSAYAFNWAAVTRLVLVVAVFGSAVAIVVELVRLASHGSSAGGRSHSPFAE